MCRNRQDADFLSGCGTFDLKEMKMKKFMFLCVVALGALTVNAGPHRRHHGNNDLRKAADIVPPKIFSLEEAIEFIQDDELIEVTPKSIRLRKKILNTELRMKEMMKIRRAQGAGK